MVVHCPGLKKKNNNATGERQMATLCSCDTSVSFFRPRHRENKNGNFDHRGSGLWSVRTKIKEKRKTH